MASNRISIWYGGREVEVHIRGCLATGDRKLDVRAEKLLGTMWPDGLFIRSDCKAAVDKSGFSAVMYDVATATETLNQKGEIEVEVLTYRMPQVLNLVYGYCLLDHSDTNYPLYQVFLEAENLAKKHRKGYWATHRDAPAQAMTNGVSRDTMR